jgi:hypothetical protein
MPGVGPGIHGKRPRRSEGSIADMTWHPSEPFPPDPNAPPSPSHRLSRPQRIAVQAPAAASRISDALERELAQLHLVGPAGGAELHQLVYGHGTQDDLR